MKEYTLLSLVSVIITIFLDRKCKTRLLQQAGFYYFLGVIFLFKLFVNGFLTAGGIVRYNPQFFLGIRLGTIPLEDFLFGFSMVTCTIIFWEYFKKDAR
jgi:lycopene cyclase domain-containing protein